MIKMSEDLMRYLAAREQQRESEVESVLARMTERERRLVREAALMGYIRGRMSVPVGPADRSQIPRDTEILHEVMNAMLAMPDLYPVTSRLLDDDEVSP